MSKVVGWVGILTAFFAATLALVQYDLKKILACSTISQLGYMVAAAGVGSPGAAHMHGHQHGPSPAVLIHAVCERRQRPPPARKRSGHRGRISLPGAPLGRTGMRTAASGGPQAAFRLG